MKRLPFTPIFAALLGSPTLASACALCDSELGRQVRAGVFNGEFVRTTLAVIAPFPLFLLAIGMVRWSLPKLMAPPASQERRKIIQND